MSYEKRLLGFILLVCVILVGKPIVHHYSNLHDPLGYYGYLEHSNSEGLDYDTYYDVDFKNKCYYTDRQKKLVPSYFLNENGCIRDDFYDGK